jgi:hypothetical protein
MNRHYFPGSLDQLLQKMLVCLVPIGGFGFGSHCCKGLFPVFEKPVILISSKAFFSYKRSMHATYVMKGIVSKLCDGYFL